MSRPQKISVTKKLLEEITSPMTLEEAMATWWVNLRQSGGLRLTRSGFDYLVDNKIQCYNFDISTGLVSKPSTLLLLDRKLDCAYYFVPVDRNTSRLSMFGERSSIMASLHSDMSSFVKYLSQSEI
jgi:hypothetical protein